MSSSSALPPSSTKLNSIYSAIDSHNYNRALKHTDNKGMKKWDITLALRAHCLDRLGRRAECLSVLVDLLDYLKDGDLIRMAGDANGSEGGRQPQASQKKGVGVKNRKGANNSTTGNGMQATRQVVDIVEEMDDAASMLLHGRKEEASLSSSPPSPSSSESIVLTDETTLATISISLRSLSLHHTILNMYMISCSTLSSLKHRSTEDYIYSLENAFSSNLTLAISASPFPTPKQTSILVKYYENMQSISLQLARLTNDKRYWNWAATNALLHSTSLEDGDTKKRLFLRLAEGFASKGAERNASEWKLFLEIQKKGQNHARIVEDLEGLSARSDDGTSTESQKGVELPLLQNQILEELAGAAERLEDAPKACGYYKRLWDDRPDNFYFGRKWIETVESYGVAELVLREKIDDLEGGDSSSSLTRATQLLYLEVLSRRCREEEYANGEDHKKALREALMRYGDLYKNRAFCTYEDVNPYLTILFQDYDPASGEERNSLALGFCEWAKSIRDASCTNDDDDDDDDGDVKDNIKAYIFGCQISIDIYNRMKMEPHPSINIADYLPNPVEMYHQWKQSSHRYSLTQADGTGQKESQPGDELPLLLTSLLLLDYKIKPSYLNLIISASILEHALSLSPHNHNLKITLLLLYHELGASYRSFQLFEKLSIKQIQKDSLSYLMIGGCLGCGLYKEVLAQCCGILGIHRNSARDVPEYTNKAFQNGNYLQVLEFIQFQRRSMKCSVTLLHAKGLIMDLAPFATTAGTIPRGEKLLGNVQGIVGCSEEDHTRANNIATEVGDWYGAPSILSIATLTKENVGMANEDDSDPPNHSTHRLEYSDNRDFTILPGYDIPSDSCVVSKSDLQSESVQRGTLHNIILRCVFCVSAFKPPKKGKRVKLTAVMTSRCESLCTAIQDAGVGGPIFTATGLIAGIILRICNGGDGAADGPEDVTLSSLQTASTALLDYKKRDTVDLFHGCLTDPTAVREVCMSLPTEIAPLYTVWQILKKLYAIQGWTYQKVKSKPYVTALARFSGLLEGILRDMMVVVCERETDYSKGIVNSVMNEMESEGNTSLVGIKQCFLQHSELTDSLESTISNILASQQETRDRVVPFMEEMAKELSEYCEVCVER